MRRVTVRINPNTEVVEGRAAKIGENDSESLSRDCGGKRIEGSRQVRREKEDGSGVSAGAESERLEMDRSEAQNNALNG